MNKSELRRSCRLLRRNASETSDKRVNAAQTESHSSKTSPVFELSANHSKTSAKKEVLCERCATKIDKEWRQSGDKRLRKWRRTYDSLSNRLLNVCITCAQLMSKSDDKSLSGKQVVANDEKLKYVTNCRSFALSLVQLFNDSEAQRLYCPNFKHCKPCACLQRYVIGNGLNVDESHKRAKGLLSLLKKAKQLSQQKCYGESGRVDKVGLGNGQKRSKEFETFVITSRQFLRQELHFCERATQKVLFYSNNFLHKKLKTEANGERIKRQKGKAATGRLIEIALLSQQVCCRHKCVEMAVAYPNLIENWRRRAAASQSDARRVLSEMLTPTQASRINCYKFISMVTGSSYRTITSVNDFMRDNGGLREPKEHGLKRFWQKQNIKKHIKHITEGDNSGKSMESLSNNVNDNNNNNDNTANDKNTTYVNTSISVVTIQSQILLPDFNDQQETSDDRDSCGNLNI